MFRRDDPEDAPRRGRNKRTSTWSTRLAAFVLIGGGALLFTRATLATVIQVHGDGMAPTILDGESVVMLRGKWGIEAGDLVVYDPAPSVLPGEPDPREPGLDEPPPEDERHGGPGDLDGRRFVDPERRARGQLHDTAVVEVDEVDSNWQRVRDRGRQPRNFRVGRVLAVPGDTVTFHVPDAALGLAINGSPLAQKADEPMRLVLAGKPAPGEDSDDVERPRMRAVAWETLGDSRYPVLLATSPTTWSGMDLPTDLGPIEIRAEGYLILADNRDEGACCDSRAIGWVPPERLRGEVVLRLAGDPGASPDSDPRSRGLALLP